MVQIVHGTDLDFKAHAYGLPSQATMNLIQHSQQQMSQQLGNLASNFTTKAQQMSQELAGSRTMRLMKAALNKITHAFMPDDIRYYDNIDTIQMAAEQMRYYIMSDETIMQMYRDQKIAGYDDHFVDIFPDQIGRTHPTYQVVNHGLIVDNEDPEVEDSIDMFFTDEDNTLTIEEQVDIKQTQELTLAMILFGKRDPTSPSNNLL